LVPYDSIAAGPGPGSDSMGGGTPPSVQARIEFEGDPPNVVRDEHGIARGGIRLPQVEVPLATNSALPGQNPVGPLGGSCVPFSKEKILGLYGDLDTYSKRFEIAALAAVEAGVLVPRAASALIAEARETFQRLTA
jgi:Alpha/beta hydrolase domain